MSPPARGLRPGPYVVVADEDPQLLDLIVRTLRDDGSCVFQAHDGRSALELSLAVPPIHLLITNTRMPGLERPELIRRFRTPGVGVRHAPDSTPDSHHFPDIRDLSPALASAGN